MSLQANIETQDYCFITTCSILLDTWLFTFTIDSLNKLGLVSVLVDKIKAMIMSIICGFGLSIRALFFFICIIDLSQPASRLLESK